MSLVVMATLVGCAFSGAPDDDVTEIRFSACPLAVRRTFQAETKAAPIGVVHQEKEADGGTLYEAKVAIGGRTYSLGVREDGTLAEMSLALDEDEVPLERCPAAVRESFQREAFGEKVESVGKDMSYGVTIYETSVEHQGKSYAIVVAEDGTLVEKYLVIDDEEVELAKCPSAVRAAFHEHARGAVFRGISRSTGLGRPTYEAEVELHGKVYVVEVGESGILISKSLETEEP